jgi:hypothetical protein
MAALTSWVPTQAAISQPGAYTKGLSHAVYPMHIQWRLVAVGPACRAKSSTRQQGRRQDEESQSIGACGVYSPDLCFLCKRSGEAVRMVVTPVPMASFLYVDGIFEWAEFVLDAPLTVLNDRVSLVASFVRAASPAMRCPSSP